MHISKLLSVTHTLQQLDISENIIDDEGITAITKVLQYSKSLSTLEVGQCGLSMKGMHCSYCIRHNIISTIIIAS